MRAGGHAMPRGARIRFAESRRIRYQIFVTYTGRSPPLSPFFSPFLSRLSRPTSRFSASHAIRACVSIVLRRSLYVTYGPRVIYHIRLQPAIAFNRVRRSTRRLIMVILGRRCKLRRACARGPVRVVSLFEKRPVQTDYRNNCETIALAT